MQFTALTRVLYEGLPWTSLCCISMGRAELSRKFQQKLPVWAPKSSIISLGSFAKLQNRRASLLFYTSAVPLFDKAAFFDNKQLRNVVIFSN